MLADPEGTWGPAGGHMLLLPQDSGKSWVLLNPTFLSPTNPPHCSDGKEPSCVLKTLITL